MAGLNLSHLRDEERAEQKSRGFFNVSTSISIAVLVLAGAAFGGLRWYIGSLDKEIAAVDSVIEKSAGQIRGDRVDRVADFDARVAFFSNRKGEFLEPQEILKKLEGVMVPGVVLTEYAYASDSETSLISGTTDDFRKLAEQMLRLKSEAIFGRVTVDELTRGDGNQILFVLNAGL